MKKLSFVLLYLLLFSCREPVVPSDESAQIIHLEHQLDSLQHLNLDLQDKLLRLKIDSTKSAQSLKYNVDFIKNALKEQTSLIPKKAVLGGKMHFGPMKVLGNNWIIAQYEDGHVQGVSIYRYELNEDSAFSFRLLDSAEEY